MNALQVAERNTVCPLQDAVAPNADGAFELMATASQGVAKLRDLVLALALRGRLVDQDTADEPGSQLLASSRRKWRQLMDAGTIKRERPAGPITSEEKRFPLPASWVWCRIVDTAQYINGLAFKPSDWGSVGRPIIRIQNLSGRNRDYHRTSKEIDPSVVVERGDILVSWSATLDAFVWTGEEGVLNQHIFRVTPSPLVDRHFLFWLLKGVIHELAASDHAHGLVMSHINRGPFLGHVVAIPPLAEQRRIVARVEELMGLCDELETRGRLQDEQHARLVITLFDALVASTSPKELAENWQRVASHFALLLDRPAAVDALEQTILQLAVRGLLAPQDPADEPAGALLTRIRKEKEDASVETRQRRNATLSAPEEGGPFDLPAGWAWAHFSELGEFGRGKSKHRPRNDPRLFNPGIYPLIQTGEVSRATQFIQEIHSYYSEDGLAQSKLWPKGTLCITIAANIADSAMLTFEACFPDSVVGFVPSPILGDTRFFHMFMSTARQRLIDFAPATAQKNINLEVLNNLLVPVPPVAEMRRIVARVEELRSLCAGLRKHLQQSRATQSNLADALVARAVA